MMKIATPIAFVWAGLLVASGMIFNVGMESCLPRALNILGLAVAAIGISSVVPALKSLAAASGAGQIVWCAWLGIVLLTAAREAKA